MVANAGGVAVRGLAVVTEEGARERAGAFDFYVVRNLGVPAWRVYRNSRHLGAVLRETAGFVGVRRRTVAEGGGMDESAPFPNRRKAAEWLGGFRS